jgi:hypothetical protein
MSRTRFPAHSAGSKHAGNTKSEYDISAHSHAMRGFLSQADVRRVKMHLAVSHVFVYQEGPSLELYGQK